MTAAELLLTVSADAWMTTFCRGYTLFAMKGRAKPIFPMACYTLYTCVVVGWLMIRVPGLNTLKQLSALSLPVGMVGGFLST